MKNENQHQSNEPWKWSYTAVLLANAVYIVIFYFVMSSYS